MHIIKKFKHSLHVCCGEVGGGGGGGGGGEHRGNFDWKVPTEGQPSPAPPTICSCMLYVSTPANLILRG